MGFQIHNDFVQLSQMLSSLQRGKVKLTEKQLDHIVSKIAQKVKDIESHSKSGFSLLNQNMKGDIIDLLGRIDLELSNYQSISKVNDAQKQILQVQKTMEVGSVRLGGKVEKPQ